MTVKRAVQDEMYDRCDAGSDFVCEEIVLGQLPARCTGPEVDMIDIAIMAPSHPGQRLIERTFRDFADTVISAYEA